ncbi:MAG: hypothetical protein ACW99Q_29790, partial [Candidatus Kariarchaeaceae archaeon]
TWKPIYITDTIGNYEIIYTNGLIVSKKIFPNQALYETQLPLGQINWIIINGTSNIAEVTVNETSILPQVESVESLENRNQISGWYFDKKSELIYIKFKSNGLDEIRILQEIEVTTPDYSSTILTIGVIVAIIIIVLEILISLRRRRSLDTHRT